MAPVHVPRLRAAVRAPLVAAVVSGHGGAVAVAGGLVVVAGHPPRPLAVAELPGGLMGTAHVVDDDGAEVIAVEEADDPQALWFRVGQVYDGDTLRKEPGIWINYQERYMASGLSGPVLLTPAVWRELVAAVDARLRRRRAWRGRFRLGGQQRSGK